MQKLVQNCGGAGFCADVFNFLLLTAFEPEPKGIQKPGDGADRKRAGSAKLLATHYDRFILILKWSVVGGGPPGPHC